MRDYFVYTLSNNTQVLYIGVTSNLQRRNLIRESPLQKLPHQNVPVILSLSKDQFSFSLGA
jgi:predicted GIY-YIG superfamily endonuclease